MPLIETIERDGYAIGIWEIIEDTETISVRSWELGEITLTKSVNEFW